MREHCVDAQTERKKGHGEWICSRLHISLFFLECGVQRDFQAASRGRSLDDLHAIAALDLSRGVSLQSHIAAVASKILWKFAVTGQKVGDSNDHDCGRDVDKRPLGVRS